MMMKPVLFGLLAAVVVAVPRYSRAYLTSIPWFSPILVLGVAVVAMLFQRFLLDRRAGNRNYDGITDLIVHIHSSSAADSPLRWVLRGIISSLLTLFGGIVGPEGAAVEFVHAAAMRVRSRSSKWFEQQRRTDAACALAAGVAAAFGAPFAAVMMPLELGLGGRTISIALSALSAFLGIRFLTGLVPVERMPMDTFNLGGALYGFHFLSWREWLVIAVIIVAAGLIGMALFRFIRYCQESLQDLFQTQTWMRTLAGGILLFLVILVYKGGHAPAWTLLEQVLWSRRLMPEVGLLFVTQLLTIALVLSAFGTVGVLWPLFALGGFLGYGINFLVFQGVPGFAVVSGLAGAAAFWGAVFGAPIAGALVAFELTQNISVLLPCLVAAYGARELRSRLGMRTLIEKDLEARGILFQEGRSLSILNSIRVRDAMVSDHETVHEREPVSELHARIMNLRYPFIPVVNSQGAYVGMLTADMIQEGWQAQDPQSANSPLSKLLEAKDLLYRTRFKAPTVKADDKLSVTSGLFKDIPCAAVLADDGRVAGLLFVYNARLAYDREVARQSLHQPRM